MLINVFESSVSLFTLVYVLISECVVVNFRLQCFSEVSTRRPSDLLSSFTTIKTVVNNLYDGLAEVILSLLKNTETRENVLEYLAEVINRNSSRAHIQVILYDFSCVKYEFFLTIFNILISKE